MHTSLLNIPLKDKTAAPTEVHLVRHDLAHCQPTYGLPRDEGPSFHLSETAVTQSN